jgi:DNA repair exonuclease SbcCD nuclease subunit
MSNKFLFTADWHLTSRPQDEYRWEVFPWIRDVLEKNKVETLFILGDLTEQKDNHPSKLVNRLTRNLQELTKYSRIVLLKGNHDYIDPKQPFFTFIDSLPAITFISSPEMATISSNKFLSLPHTKDISEWDNFNFQEADYILLHQAIAGATTENGFKVGGIEKDMFSRRKIDGKVIAGDIHVPQKIGNIIYCGAPHPIKFGDMFTPRVLLADGNRLISIERETIRKLKIILSLPEELKECTLKPNDQVKIVLRLPRTEFSTWKEYKKEILTISQDLGIVLCGVELQEEKPKVRKRLKVDTAPEVKTALPEDVYNRYCAEHNINEFDVKAGKGFL